CFLTQKTLEYDLLTILPSFIKKGELLEGYDGVEELKVKVPAFVIMGEKDYALKIPGLAYFLNEMVKDCVLDMETTNFPEGSHFVYE
ncbi:hypothetical protein GIB67_017357, partial [Kingdonia uniflora]